MSTEAWGVISGVVFGIVGWWAGRHERRVARENFELSAAQAASQWLSDIRVWAAEAVDVLSEAQYRSSDTLSEEVLRTCKHRLSALVDRGRFFLPNRRYPGFPQLDKHEAYRGSRHAALDPLVAAINVLDGTIGSHKDTSSALEAMRREFVSRIQSILSPEAVNQQVVELVAKSRNQKLTDETLGGLITKHHAPGADRLLNPTAK
ncbi:MAG: hypothetical protein JNM62_10105 [Flavobacteriales bacterium]|nr:hypothetical protein [Flavobacteriales bacterium]